MNEQLLIVTPPVVTTAPPPLGPAPFAEFESKVQSTIVPPERRMAPPVDVAELFVKVQPDIVAPDRIDIAPPIALEAWLFSNVQFVIRAPPLAVVVSAVLVFPLKTQLANEALQFWKLNADR